MNNMNMNESAKHMEEIRSRLTACRRISSLCIVDEEWEDVTAEEAVDVIQNLQRLQTFLRAAEAEARAMEHRAFIFGLCQHLDLMR